MADATLNIFSNGVNYDQPLIDVGGGKHAPAVALVNAGGSGTSIASVKGAANVAVGQVATSVTAATFVIARATRRSVTLRNFDTAISVYIGPATVTSSNGMILKAGESINLTWVGLIQVIAASGTPTVGYVDEYD